MNWRSSRRGFDVIRREDISRPGEIQGVKIGSLFIVNNLEDGRVYIFDDDARVNFSFPLSSATVHAGGTVAEALKALNKKQERDYG